MSDWQKSKKVSRKGSGWSNTFVSHYKTKQNYILYTYPFSRYLKGVYLLCKIKCIPEGALCRFTFGLEDVVCRCSIGPEGVVCMCVLYPEGVVLALNVMLCLGVVLAPKLLFLGVVWP